MKTERRHELQQNELNQMLASGSDWFQKHGMTVLWTLAGLAVVVAGFQYMRSRSQATLDQAYDVFGNLAFATKDEAKSSIDQLKALTTKVSDNGFVLRSLGYQAGLAAMHAVDTKTGAIDTGMLAEAKQAYEETVRRFPDAPLETGAALLGLASIEENYFALDGDASRKAKSKEYLEQVVGDSRLAGTPLSKVAVDRLNNLDKTFQVVNFVDAPPPPPPVETTSTEPATPAPVEPAPPTTESKPSTESAENKDKAEPSTQPETPKEEAPAESSEPKPESGSIDAPKLQ